MTQQHAHSPARPVALRVKDLHITFNDGNGGLFSRGKKTPLRAVRGISFDVYQGETFSLVGESGCGKSTVARALVGLWPISQGSIEREDHHSLSGQAAAAQNIQMIFQDPYASLNPRWRVERIIAEPLNLQGRAGTPAEVRQRVGELLRQVGLSGQDMFKYPHEFSGGQRQRISIARALSTQPALMICDEPTSALDVSVQAQVLNLMSDLKQRLGLTYFFISHNMSVIHHFSDRVGVMYLGRIVELGPVERIFHHPGHPYTRMLIDTIPQPGKIRSGTPLSGEIPSPLAPPPGCAFQPRCPHATELCRREAPPVRALSAEHHIECHYQLDA
ncbi:Dipeptide transport ATP-binding protein DppF [Paramixta manurensis]|uniref:Dipeptide transport ATP-binding protein DppF n=1 Tax=Paramixta manurensis TaxID=2740817 RepID=A0A6M8UE29_9GAMM|nr:Dipeptide transport ATP-binding protein DppF [Erwiniaceae bacterium PD-1]